MPVPPVPSGCTSPVTRWYPTGRAAFVLKSTIETWEPVPDSALRNAREARRTFSAFEPIEPDLSSTSITLIPQRCGRAGFGPGAVTVRAFVTTFSALAAPPQRSVPLAVKPAL